MRGQFDAKIVDYGLSLSKGNTVQFAVKLQYQVPEEEGTHEITWYKSTVDGSKEIALKSLLICGLKPSDFGRLMMDFNKGPASNLLDLNKVLRITLDEEPTLSDPTKMVTKCAWINDPDFSSLKKLSEQEQAQYASRFNFAGELTLLYQKGGFDKAQKNFVNHNAQSQMPLNNPTQQQYAPPVQQYQQAPQQQYQQPAQTYQAPQQQYAPPAQQYQQPQHPGQNGNQAPF